MLFRALTERDMTTVTRATPSTAVPGQLIDRFIPEWDIRERHEVLVRAPAAIVHDVAWNLDVEAIPLVRAIFWLREKLMGAHPPREIGPRGLVAWTRALGWGTLAEEPGRLLVAGAVTEPWQADVAFRPLSPETFADYAEPGHVKIVWTLEIEDVGRGLTRFASETRARATDAESRQRFLRYWRGVSIGVVLIRRLVAVAVRRAAERRWERDQKPGA